MVLFSRKYFFFLLLCVFSSASAQNHTLDSLMRLLKVSKEDSSRVNLYVKIADEYADTQYDSASSYSDKAMQLSNKLGFRPGQARAWYRSGYVLIGSDNDRALRDMQKGLVLMEVLGMKKEISSVLSDIAYVNQQQGKIDTALAYFFRAKKIDEENNDKEGISYAYNNIGTIYYYQGKVETALDYFHKSLTIREELKQISNIGNSLNNIAGIYMAQRQNEKAFEYLTKALSVISSDTVRMDKGIAASILTNLGQVCEMKEMFDEGIGYLNRGIKLNEAIGERAGLAHCYNAMGNILHAQKKEKESLDYLLKALKITEEISLQRVRSHVLINIAETYIDLGDYDKALSYADEGMKFAREIGFPENIESAARALSIVYARKHDYRKAYEFHVLAARMNDSVTNKENAQLLNDMQTKYETEKKDKEILLLNKDNEKQAAVAAAEQKRQQVILLFVLGILFLVVLFSFFIFRSYRQKKKDNVIISAQKSEVEKQKHIIEEKNKDITDSINYAQRIQRAVLPDWKEVEKIFPDSFLIYKPKDIISGDFYWFSEKEKHVLLAACDCTGHGVPGTLMSIIGSSLLHQIVNEKSIIDPAVALTSLDSEMTKALHQKGFEGESRDGMDIALIEIDKQKRTLRYAGANRPVYIIRNKRLIEVQPDKNPIGGFFGSKKFNTKIESLFAGDCLYLFSDGYADQFGGEKQKKITTKKFKETLLSVHALSMNEQGEFLNSSFEQWKGVLEQIDDVLVIGLRI